MTLVSCVSCMVGGREQVERKTQIFLNPLLKVMIHYKCEQFLYLLPAQNELFHHYLLQPKNNRCGESICNCISFTGLGTWNRFCKYFDAVVTFHGLVNKM